MESLSAADYLIPDLTEVRVKRLPGDEAFKLTFTPMAVPVKS